MEQLSYQKPTKRQRAATVLAQPWHFVFGNNSPLINLARRVPTVAAWFAFAHRLVSACQLSRPAAASSKNCSIFTFGLTVLSHLPASMSGIPSYSETANMRERRKNFRVEWNSPGKIYHRNGRFARLCIVRNFSNGDARITGVEPGTVPDEFILRIFPHDHGDWQKRRSRSARSATGGLASRSPLLFSAWKNDLAASIAVPVGHM